jgi:hypothetical protein
MRPISASALLAILVPCALQLAAPPRASALAFTGELSISILTLEPIGVRGGGTSVVTTRDGAHLAGLGLEANVFSGAQVSVPVTDPAAAPIRGLQATLANQAASFAETAGGGFGGSMPLSGAVKVCLFGSCSAAVANIEVPLTPIGVGGSTFVSAAVNLTVAGAPWTTRTVSVGTVSVQGAARGPLGGTSSTAQEGGQLNVVTPVYVSTNIGVSSVVPVFGFLRMGFGSLLFPICDDGIDNDGDGLVDYPEDPGCGAANDESENDPGRPCDDGIDNDGDGATDYPSDAGCLSLADPSEGPDVLCDVAMSQSSYGNGDTAVLSSLRFRNLEAAPVETRLRLQLRLPSAVLYTIDAIDIGAGGGFSIPGSFDRQLGPATIFTVSPTTPPLRGSFEWRCALEDPDTGEVFVEDRAAFYVY